MKRKRHIFIEFSSISLGIITAIILIYTIAQLITISIVTRDYQEDYIKNRYKVLSYVFSKISIDENSIKEIADDDEKIRIYKEDFSSYFSNDNDEDEWKNVDLYFGRDVKVETKYNLEGQYVILSGPININKERYIMQIISDGEMNEDIFEGYYHIFFIIFIFGIVLSVLGSFHLSKKFLKKINNLSNEIEEVKKNGVSHRIRTSGSNDEFDRITVLFNSMMDEIEETFEEQKVFISNASHELRTPLTALKGHLSMIKRWGKNDKECMEKSLDICIDETDRLIKIVNELLMLTRAEREVFKLSEIDKIKIRPVILDCVNHYKILHENVEFDVQVDEEDYMRIKEEHLKQILIIFIDNSIKYNDKEVCRIIISLNEKNKRKELTVKDNGMGIPEEDIPYVLNKFYKVDKSRVNNNSYGIGLSIANQIVKNYKGEISISSKESIYTEIKIVF